MKEFKAARVDTAGVIVRVKDLFKGHRELILGFNTFLPKGYEIEMPLDEDEQKPVEFDQAINYVNKIKTRFANDERVYKAFLEILNMYRKSQKTITNVYEEVAMLFKNHSDLLEEFTYFLPDSTPPAAQGQKRVTGKRTDGPPLRTQRQETARQQTKRKGRHHDDEEEGSFARTNMAKELTFFEKVKAKLRSREGYQDFLKCLNLYAQEVISKQELTSLVHDLIGRFSDLAIGFNEFLSRCEHLDFEFDGKQHGKMTLKDITRMKQLSQAEKLQTRPISELDVSSWQRCSTSYVQLPKNYPPMTCHARTPQLAALLNDQWVSVTSGSEDYSFKHMRKNQYEEALFRVEDDRFELDMAIETNASALRAMQKLVKELEDLQDRPERERWAPAPGALTAIHYRAAHRIYGDHGSQIVELLRKNPQVAVPVVCARLQQKDEEWRKNKAAMAPMWQKVYDANYHKSLDHRSFYFKQTDKRSLGAKGMLSDIRELVEKRRLADGGLAAVSAAADFSARLHPDITYEFTDRNVHEDIYVILRDACKEMMPADLAAKTLAFYTGLVEHFFGLKKRTPEEVKVSADEEDDQEMQDVKSPTKMAKHKRLAMLAADGGNGDTDTDAGADEDPDKPAANAAGAAMLMDAAAGAAEAEEEPEQRESPEARTGANGQANSGVSSDDAAAATEKEAAGPSAALRGPAPAGSDVVDDSSDDELDPYSNGRHSHCRPLAAIERSGCFPCGKAAAAAAAAEAGIAAPSVSPTAASEPKAQHVLYGNETYYVFFRLHQYLYDRLRVAHICSHKKQGYLVKNSNGEADQKSPEEYKATHNRFMALVKDLITGNTDASTYEDNCRTLLGTGSYVLFTLEKLIFKWVKQMQLIVQDDLTESLHKLYRYEHSRGSGPPCDATYFANAHVLLHDDTCFRFAALPDGKVTLQMMDPDKTEVPAALMDTKFAKYLKSFVEGSAQPADGIKKVFLLRNFPAPVRADPSCVSPPLDDAELINGLECKLNCGTSKVSYVLDTEDVFRRKGARSGGIAPQVAAEKAQRFQQWAASRLPQPAQAPHQPPTVTGFAC